MRRGYHRAVVSTRRRRILQAALILAAAAFYLPLFGHHWFETHESIWYPVRTIEYAHIWSLGDWYPRWCPDFYGGYGSPFFNYAPPLVYMLGAVGVSAGLTAEFSLKLVILFFSALGALGVWKLVEGETGRSDAAFVAASVFVAAPYRFFDLFQRGDLSEYAAIAVLPWCLWLYRALLRAPDERQLACALGAALSHAVLLFSHTILGLWGTELIALALALPLLRAWRAGRRRSVSLSVLALGGAIGLSAIYTVPAFFERELVKIGISTLKAYEYRRHFIEWTSLFRPGVFFLGWPLLAAAAAAAIACLVPATRPRLRAAAPWWGATLLLCWLPTRGAEPIWPLFPLGPFIQFPWRLLGLAAVCGAVAVGTSWAGLIQSVGARGWLVVLAAAGALSSAIPEARVVQYIEKSAISPRTPRDISRFVWGANHGEGFLPREHMYVPTAPRGERYAHLLDDSVRIVRAVPSGLGYALKLEAAKPGSVETQSLWFPGWQVDRVSGPATPTLAPSAKGRVQLDLARPGSYELQVIFGNTAARTAGNLLTWLSVILLYPTMRLISRRVIDPVGPAGGRANAPA
jgi:hypothetical protein